MKGEPAQRVGSTLFRSILAVHRVADDRIAGVGELDADLVAATGLELPLES